MPLVIEYLHNPVVSRIRQAQFILAVIIFATLVLMPNPASIGLAYKDFVLHFLGNTLLILSAWVACIGRFSPLVPLVFAIPYSLILELSQVLTASRTPEISDIMANMAGLFAGFLIALLLNKLITRKEQAQE